MFTRVYIFFNWGVIALPCCIGFCHTRMRIRHNYIYIFISLYYTYVYVYISPSSASLPPSHPSRSSQSASLGSLCYTQLPSSCLFHTQYCTRVSAASFTALTLSSPTASTSLFSTSPFRPCNKFISIIFLDSIHMC